MIKVNKGFSLLELVTVIAIIMILAGIGAALHKAMRNRAEIARAKAVITKLEMAVEMYRTDTGSYPISGDLLELLNAANVSLHAPYIDNRDFVSPDFVDPWGTPYNYSPGTESVTIRSFGPDKTDNSGTGDDISNIGIW